MEWILSNITEIFTGVTALVTFASVIANMTKTESDNKAIAAVSKVVNALALNFTAKK